MPKHTKIEILTKHRSFLFICQEGITYIFELLSVVPRGHCCTKADGIINHHPKEDKEKEKPCLGVSSD